MLITALSVTGEAQHKDNMHEHMNKMKMVMIKKKYIRLKN